LTFSVEIYDIETQQRLDGDDTSCRITILDEDLPGKLGFEVTDMQVERTADRIDVRISRVDGTDGKVSCILRTEAYLPGE